MDPQVYFGTVFYSDYFKSYCVVVRYRNDDDWYFVVENRPTHILKAQTSLRSMKRKKLGGI